MKIKLVTLDLFNSFVSNLTGHPFYILPTITSSTKDNVKTYVETHFKETFKYGINIIRIETKSGGGTAVVIANKHTYEGEYGAYIIFGYGYPLSCRRLVDGTWLDG